MVFVILASFWPVTSNLMSYVTGIGFQSWPVSASFTLILKLDLWAVK